MLTRRQLELLLFINTEINRDGVSPSYEEMRAAVGLKSKSGINRLVVSLEERGFIRRLSHRARAIEVLRLPRDCCVLNALPRENGIRRDVPHLHLVSK